MMMISVQNIFAQAIGVFGGGDGGVFSACGGRMEGGVSVVAQTETCSPLGHCTEPMLRTDAVDKKSTEPAFRSIIVFAFR